DRPNDPLTCRLLVEPIRARGLIRTVADRTVAFLGGGRMGEALVWGLIRSGGRTREELIVTCRREERARDLSERLGVATTLSNPEAVKSAPTLVLTVKPQDMETLLGQIQHYLSPQ